MLKNATYKEKFSLLNDWLHTVVKSIQSDLKAEHLKKDPKFLKVYFANKNPSKLSTEELVHGYRQALAIEENAEAIAEFISNRWMLKHTDIYDFFEKNLSRIAPNFTEIEELDHQAAHSLMEHAISEFGAHKTYLFSVINSVVFPKTVYDQLRHRALQEEVEEAKETKLEQERLSLTSMQQFYEAQMSRLIDKYEKKLLGMQKKYIQDIDALKKQVASLQRKLHDK